MFIVTLCILMQTVDFWLFRDLDEALEMGMDWSLREGYVWAEDKVTGQYFISLNNNFLDTNKKK